mmetsp:Transcript_24613/g.27386  ORF Transcript_24613/g.27386 Transcript_24613/m.27386 type:complete len:88 (+) Transcript_24613:646-909(+)
MNTTKKINNKFHKTRKKSKKKSKKNQKKKQEITYVSTKSSNFSLSTPWDWNSLRRVIATPRSRAVNAASGVEAESEVEVVVNERTLN